MVKFKVIKVEQPNCFIGQDLSIFESINTICKQLSNSNSTILPCSEVISQKIYLTEMYHGIVRIRVLSSVNSNTYRCFLIDHGTIEEVKRNKIYNLPLNQLDIDPAIKMIKIPGIRPAGMTDICEGSNIVVHLSESDKWMPASYKYVTKRFEEQGAVSVNYLKSVSKDKALVDILINHNNERTSLKDLLVKEKFAFFCNEIEGESLENNELEVERGDGSEARVEKKSITTDKYDTASIDSIENRSISFLIDEMATEETRKGEASSSNRQIDNYSINASVDSRRVVSGGLDEVSTQVLEIKLKCWVVSRSYDAETHTIQCKYLNPIRPVTSYRGDALVASFLKEALLAFDTKMFLLIQTYMFPIVLRGVNLVAISPTRKGKSMGLLMPIIQCIATKQFSQSRSFNPLAIILCSSWRKVKELSSAAEKFIRFIPESGKTHKPRVVEAFGGSLEKMTMIPVLQGCDILIITPACLLSWLRQHEFFKLNELEIFCLDDAENIIAEHLDTLREILIFKRTGAIDRGCEPHQFITATHWTSGLESYVKHEMSDLFNVVVSDPLEVAVIQRVKQKIIEYDNIDGELYKNLTDYLKLTQSSIKRTVIFANDDVEIGAIYRYLMQKINCDLKLLTGSNSCDEMKAVVNEWNQYRGFVNMPILLISDEALRTSELSIFNAEIMIHADVNEECFGHRLNFLREKFSELPFLKQRSDRPEEQEKYNSYIFLCPKTIRLETANFLYKFLGRCNSDRPSWLQDKAVDFILTKEKSKGSNEICPRIKSYGECKLPGCRKRHMVISDIDKPLLPNKGFIQFRILYMESPSNFFVRITEILNTDGSKTLFKSQYLSLKMKMSNYFNNPQNIHGVNLRLIQVGLMAAIKTKDILERVTVIRMKPGSVWVKLIDEGSIKIVEQADLLYLPRELSEIVPQAVEVYVTSMKPVDNDEYYSDESVSFAREFLQDCDLHGIIRLCIGSTLWIDAVTQRIHHARTNVTVFDKNLSVTLLHKNLIEKNPQHMDKLVRLCTGKIDIWKPDSEPSCKNPIPMMRKFSYEDMPVEFEKLPIIDDDNELSTECTLAHLISPNFIFLNNRETIQALRDIQNQIESLIDSIETLSIKGIKMGARVLYYRDSKWHRGYVINTHSDIQIFSLDTGSIEIYNPLDAQLKRLPSEYQQLPYQAILCGLYFCSHHPNSYSENVNSAIKHYANSFGTKKALLNITAYNEETIDENTFTVDNYNNLAQVMKLDIFHNLKRYIVTVSNPSLQKFDEMLHDVLIRNQDVLPSVSWIHEVLPESRAYVSRLVRNGSVPHLASDVLSTKDIDKRSKLLETIERLIDKKKEAYTISGSVSNNISTILHSIAILIHFINDRTLFMYIYRSLHNLLNLAYDKNHIIEDSMENETFSIKYVTTLLISYDSIIYHMLRHLEMSARTNQIENCRIILDNFRMMLLDPSMVTCLFSESSWYVVMAVCVACLQQDTTLYNLLMDILVQLVMLWDDHKPVLGDILNQCCQAIRQSVSPSVWNSSLALISCFVNKQNYSGVLRSVKFFETLFDKFVDHYRKIEEWDEILDNALDVMTNMWRNGSASSRDILRRRKLSVELEDLRIKYVGNTVLSRFITDILLEESSVVMGTLMDNSENSATSHSGRYAPDPDALDWLEGREHFAKKHRQSFKKLYCESDSYSSSEENSCRESDSDSSDAEVIPFLNGVSNPADEDNVPCFEKP